MRAFFLTSRITVFMVLLVQAGLPTTTFASSWPSCGVLVHPDSTGVGYSAWNDGGTGLYLVTGDFIASRIQLSLRHVAEDGTQWANPVLLSAMAGSGQGPCLGLFPGGDVIVGWREFWGTNGYAVPFLQRVTSDGEVVWPGEPRRIFPGNACAWSLSLVPRSDNRVLAAYARSQSCDSGQPESLFIQLIAEMVLASGVSQVSESWTRQHAARNSASAPMA